MKNKLKSFFRKRAKINGSFSLAWEQRKFIDLLDFERPDKYHFIIKEIYQNPKPGFENGFFYKTVIIPVKCSKEDYDYLIQCRKWAGDCWNALVKADKEYYAKGGK